MDVSQDPVRDRPEDLLRSLLLRVSDLEREIADLKAAAPDITSRSAATPPPPPTARVFEPLPPALRRFLPGEPEAAGFGSGQPGLPAAGQKEARSSGDVGLSPAQASSSGAAASQARPAAPPRSLEDRLGSQVFNRVGIVALLIAASWGLKLAFENQWIGPVGRIAIGLLAGAGIVLWSERFRRKGFPAFSYSLKAVGTGVLYLTLWAGFQIYGLLAAPVALGLMIGVTAWNAFMAWLQDAELLAAFALSGAFATPLLLSTGGNHEVFLFTYIGAIDLATLLLVRLKPWPRLLLSALFGTVAFYAGWYLRFYNLFSSSMGAPPFGVTLIFLAGFTTLFALGSVRGFTTWPDDGTASMHADPARVGGRAGSRSPAILSVLVPLLNATFFGVALSLLVKVQYSTDALPWLMVGLSVVYLLLTQVQRTVMARALHLAIAVIFLTIAIPLKASGHTLTIAWFAEGLVLLWVSTRFREVPAAGLVRQPWLTPARVLRGLSFAGYVLGLLALCFDRFLSGLFDRGNFADADLLACLVGAGAFAGAAWLSLRSGSGSPEGMAASPIGAVSALLGLDAVGIILISRELDGHYRNGERAFGNADFGSALLGLAVLAGAALLLRWLAPASVRASFRNLAGGTFVLFNLMAILSVETEINALWSHSEANLQRSLAISAFLMVYGAILLTTGFVRRSAFTRWQALILILFTILKVFLYDISSLSQGYRVLSFLALGVLLMAVSFAYQKDWLGLKSVPIDAAPGSPVQSAAETGP